jgi:hypothetical protein
MGWSYTCGAGKQEIVDDLTRTWEGGNIQSETVARSVVGNHLWYVIEHTRKDDDSKERFIALSLLGYNKGCGWGSKDMAEESHPYYYDCPLKFLDMAPPASEEWREKVRVYHEKKRERRRSGPIEEGKTYLLQRVAEPFKGQTVKIVRVQKTGRTGKGRRYSGVINGNQYRILAKQIGEEVMS